MGPLRSCRQADLSRDCFGFLSEDGKPSSRFLLPLLQKCCRSYMVHGVVGQQLDGADVRVALQVAMGDLMCTFYMGLIMCGRV